MIEIYWTEQRSRQLPEGGDSEELTIELLQLDIAEQDTYDVATEITSHAVEAGVPISDHATPQQDRAMVTVMVSGRQSTTRFVEGTRAGSFDAQDDITGAGIIVPDNDRVGEVHTTLRRLCREAIEVDVDGLRRPIEGWLIESVSSPRNVETSGLLVCDISLVEVRYAETEDVEAPSPRVERGRRSRNRGRQQSSPSPSPEEPVSSEPEERQSVLYSWLDW